MRSAAAIAALLTLAAAVAAVPAVAGIDLTGPVETQAPPPGGQPMPGRGRGTPLGPLPPGTGFVVGQVVESGTRRPIPGAIVMMSGRGATPLRVMADARGRFVFRDLPAGSFYFSASKAGYASAPGGSRTEAGQPRPVELADGERLGDLTLRLWKFGSITGTVADDSGEPVPAVRVRALRRTAVGGRWILLPEQTATPDDHGVYRLGRLPPADYIVVAHSNEMAGLDPSIVSVLAADPAAIVGFAMKAAAAGGMDFVEIDEHVRIVPPTFYPAETAVGRAAIVPVGPGEERAGVDFQVAPVRFFRVSGTIEGPAGPVENVNSLRLAPADDAAGEVPDLEVAVSTGVMKGRFEFLTVTPGRYVIRALHAPRPAQAGGARGGGGGLGTGRGLAVPLPTEPTLWAAVPITVSDASLTNVLVRLQEGFRVSGRVDFEGSAPPLTPDQLAALAPMLEPAVPVPQALAQQARGRVEPDATFRTMGVAPGRYVLRLAGSVARWTLKSITLGARDLTDLPFDIDADLADVVIVLTDQPLASVAGSVTTAEGRADGTARVFVFAADRRLWSDFGANPRRLRTASTSPIGAYSVSGLPPGEYFAVAVTGDGPAEWENPETLERLARSATRIQLGAGERRALDLRANGR